VDSYLLSYLVIFPNVVKLQDVVKLKGEEDFSGLETQLALFCNDVGVGEGILPRRRNAIARVGERDASPSQAGEEDEERRGWKIGDAAYM